MGTQLSNDEVAGVFYEMADLLHIQGGNKYRVRAFTRAGRVIENLPEPVHVMLRFNTLQLQPGIGDGTVHRIKQILRTSSCDDHRAMRAELPPGLRDMLEVKGIGARTARLIWQHLKIGSIDELEAAAKSGKLQQLPRVGEGTVARILRGIDNWRTRIGRVPLIDAQRVGRRLLEGLQEAPEVQRIALCGSVRRGKASIGDLDILVGADDRLPVVSKFVTLPFVEEVLVHGEGRCAVRLQNRQQCDLRVLDPRSFGAGMHYFTGNNLHNIHLRGIGNRHQLKISDKGIFRRSDEARILWGETEEEIFASVGLPWIPPELRENLGEIEAAAKGRLPKLVTEADLRGDLHMHTTASDGKGTARQMAQAAMAIGLEYIAITDHTEYCEIARGQDASLLAAQMRHLWQLDEEMPGIKILAGAEVDILPDGSLDIDLGLLQQLDWVIASVHSQLEMPGTEMTARLIRAMETGVVDCIGHPQNRKLGRRNGSRLDLERLFLAARKLDVCMEVNGNPYRMDLSDRACRMAREYRVPLVINTDAHAPHHLHYREYGVLTARRGWVGPSDVLNTRPWQEIADRRAQRLGRGITASPTTVIAPAAPSRPPELSPSTGTDAEVAALNIALRRTPLDPGVTARIQSYLQDGNDPPMETALRLLGDNPMQAAFDLLFS
jgi:DNA polymerase (family X)